MADNEREVIGKYEAPLVIVGSSTIAQRITHEHFYTSDDPEYHSYQDLLRGYLEKFTRWHEILTAAEYQENDEFHHWRGFGVFRSDDGFSIAPTTPYEGDDPPNKILQVRVYTYLNMPERGLFGKQFVIRTGRTAKHLLIDPDGEPLTQITVDVGTFIGSTADKYLEVKTDRLDITRGRRYFAYRQVRYELSESTLKVSHKYSSYDVMTDEMATSLINTIDSLIPQVNPPLPKSP